MHPPLEKSTSLAALPGIRHGFFGRRGGISEGEFLSLNVSAAVGDDRANVVENIHRAVMALKSGPMEVALVNQVHGTDVHVVNSTFAIGERPQADALVTSRPGLALGIVTADCVPVLLADAGAGVIGAAHAGWKGAVGEIVAQTVSAMESLGADRANIVAAIGPAISAQHYEIGDEMAARIKAEFPHAAPFVITTLGAKPHFDVPGLVRHQAETLELQNVETLKACTYALPEAYFSHRYATHNDIRTGRQIALIARS